jgi:hypothetical protein
VDVIVVVIVLVLNIASIICNYSDKPIWFLLKVLADGIALIFLCSRGVS